MPTLRFYRWSPACLSIGALQSAESAIADDSGEPGVDWVRRLSGGRALLHDDELTYAVIAPAGHPLMHGSVRESHSRIAALLAEGLQECGIPAAIEPAGRKLRATSACYDVASDFELTVQGRKLVGSAQVRRSYGILQHGSIPFRFDVDATVQRLRLSGTERDELAAILRERVIGLADVMAEPPTDGTLIDAMRRVWERHDMSVESGDLTAEEFALARSLIEKYRSREWNALRQLPPRHE